MARWQEQPRVGQSVWSDAKKNGIIQHIDWSSKLVYCNHYHNGLQTYELEDFFGCYDERLSQWIIIPI